MFLTGALSATAGAAANLSQGASPHKVPRAGCGTRASTKASLSNQGASFVGMKPSSQPKSECCVRLACESDPAAPLFFLCGLNTARAVPQMRNAALYIPFRALSPLAPSGFRAIRRRYVLYSRSRSICFHSDEALPESSLCTCSSWRTFRLTSPTSPVSRLASSGIGATRSRFGPSAFEAGLFALLQYSSVCLPRRCASAAFGGLSP